MVCIAPGGSDKIILLHHNEQVGKYGFSAFYGCFGSLRPGLKYVRFYFSINVFQTVCIKIYFVCGRNQLTSPQGPGLINTDFLGFI